MKRVLIIGNSGGIGRALDAAHREQGWDVIGLSRRATGFELTNETVIADQLGHIDGTVDRVIIATGALEIDGYSPEKTISSLTAQGMMDQFAVNAIGPALVLKHLRPLLPRDQACHVGVLSARVGSIGDNRLGGWISYRSAKAALNQIIRTTSIEWARSHPMACLIAIHPGTVATDFTAKYAGRHATVPADAAAQNLMTVIASKEPTDTGTFVDWQNIPVQW